MSKRAYKLVAGVHYEGNVRHNTGDIVVSTHNLKDLFVGKFEDAVLPAGQPEVSQEPKSDGDKTPARALVESSLGTDVTGQFPSATKTDVLVFQSTKKKGGYFIAEPDAPEKALNTTPLLTEDEVNKFVEQV